MALDFFKAVGTGVGQFGHVLGLPELGLSEKIANVGAPKAQQFRVNNNPTPVFDTNRPVPSAPVTLAAPRPNNPKLPYNPNDPNDPNNPNHYQLPDIPVLPNAGLTGPLSGAPLSPPASANQAAQPLTDNPYNVLNTLPPRLAPNPTQAAYMPQYQTLPTGERFDLSDRGQHDAYLNSLRGYLDNQYNTSLGLLNTQSQQDLGNADRTYGENVSGINRDLGNLANDRTNYQRQYANQVHDFGNNYGVGSVNRANYFATLSPNALQSSQLGSQQYADNMYNRGLGDLSASNATNLGQFNQQETGLNQSLGDLQNSYNQYQTNEQNSINQQKQGLTNQRQGLLNQAATDLTNTDVSQYGRNVDTATNPFSYNRQTYNPFATQQTDLSQYSPYTNFQSLQSSPTANIYAGSTPQAGGLLVPQGNTNQSSLENYLGYQLPQQNKSAINAYLTAGR